MGSISDKEIMQNAVSVLKKFDVPHEVKVVSAHRSPELMFSYAKEAETRGIKIIIAGAGGAAHLPGMVAALTTIPVIGVPVKSSNSLDGWDSLLSIVQMPNDVPVATVAVNGAHNAAMLAIQMLAIDNKKYTKQLKKNKEENLKKVIMQQSELLTNY
jgi:5-(carboxyamino)imidazole ribonucleotide mutase